MPYTERVTAENFTKTASEEYTLHDEFADG